RAVARRRRGRARTPRARGTSAGRRPRAPASHPPRPARRIPRGPGRRRRPSARALRRPGRRDRVRTGRGHLVRPVRLEVEGFTTFRAPTVVDFTGADLFALVGPTGSGKTSVIDALTFALYGS